MVDWPRVAFPLDTEHVLSEERQTHDSLIGQTVASYTLLERLGGGSGGDVYAARDERLDRVVAIKLLHAHTVAAGSRLLREARLQAQIDHPHVCKVFEAGEADGPSPAQRRMFIAMQMIHGQPLNTLCREMTIEQKVKVMKEVSEGVHDAHRVGLIHRDIKPTNIIVEPTEDGVFRPYVVDFGLARLEQEGDSTLTQRGAPVGTPSYMSPEQASGGGAPVDRRSDVYGLGATLYELLCGRPPYTGTYVIEILTKIIEREPPAPRRLVRSIPRELEWIVKKAMERDRDRRYQSARAFAEDLGRFLDGEPVQARAAGMAHRARRLVRRHKVAIKAAAATFGFLAILTIAFGVAPEIRRAALDHHALRQAVAAKHNVEARFDALLKNGDYDQAIVLGEQLFGQTPSPLLGLNDPARAEAYADLHETYTVSLPRAYLQRGMRLLAAGDPLGRTDLSNAYRTAIAAAKPDAETGSEAALLLGRELESEGKIEQAGAIYRIGIARFGSRPNLIAASARVLERSGRLDEAFTRWRSLSGDSRFAGEAKSALKTLAFLRPRYRLPPAGRCLAAADLDADGKCELANLRETVLTLCRVSPTGYLNLATLKLPFDHEGIQNVEGNMELLDADGDGRLEAVCTVGQPDAGIGRLYVVELSGREPRVAAWDDLTSRGLDISSGDLDGDGRPELLAGIHYHERSVRVYRYNGRQLEKLDAWPVGSDPFLVAIGPYGAGGAARVLMCLGPWSKENGFRASLFVADPISRLKRVSTGLDRFEPTHVIKAADQSFVLAVKRSEAGRKVIPNLLPAGLYRLDLGNDAIRPLTLLAGPWPDDTPASHVGYINSKSGSYLAFCSAGELHLVSTDGREHHTYGVDPMFGRSEQELVSADFDGDGEQELLLRGDEFCDLFGYGGAQEPVVSDIAAKTTLVSAREGGPGVDLLEAGLHAQAEAMLRRELDARPSDSSAWYHLGMALAAQGRHLDAAGAYAEAARDRSLTGDAGLRRVWSLEAAGEWKTLRDAVRDSLENPSTDPLVAQQLARIEPWASQAAAMKRVALVDKWLPGTPLFCANPFLVRRSRDGLEVWDSNGPASAVGLPLMHQGGPLRLMYGARIGTLNWDTGVDMGLVATDHLSGASETGDPVSFRLTIGAGGSSQAPAKRWVWYSERQGHPPMNRYFPPDEYLPELAADFVCDIQLIPGLDRALVSATRRDGKPLLPAFQADLAAIPEKGLYLAGQRDPSQSLACNSISRFLLKSVEVWAAAPGDRIAPPEDPSAAIRLLLANGVMVLGDTKKALEAYDSAIGRATIEGDSWTLWRAHLFRALCYTRAGKDEQAVADVRQAVDLEPREVMRLLECTAGSGAISSRERQVLLDAARRTPKIPTSASSRWGRWRAS